MGWSLSPDGTRVAYRALVDGNYDIWIKELGGRRNPSRLTFHAFEERMPRWTPDGERVTFISYREGPGGVFWKAADGTGEVEAVFDGDVEIAQGFFGPDGEWLLLRTSGIAGAQGYRDILALRPGTDSIPLPLLAEPYDEVAPALSPNGRWLAHGSNETGAYEVYVRSFPDVDEGGRWQISTNGGTTPVWARDRNELYYESAAGEMMAVRFDDTSGFRVLELTVLFTIPDDIVGRTTWGAGTYDVTPDGERFLMVRRVPVDPNEDRREPRWILVQNFVEELKEKVGGGR
jgi:Tol biopolymer transport system component